MPREGLSDTYKQPCSVCLCNLSNTCIQNRVAMPETKGPTASLTALTSRVYCPRLVRPVSHAAKDTCCAVTVITQTHRVSVAHALVQGFSSPRVHLPTETSVQSAGPRPLKRKASEALPAKGDIPQQPCKQGPLREVLTNGTNSPLVSSQAGSMSQGASEDAEYSSDAHQTPSTGRLLCLAHSLLTTTSLPSKQAGVPVSMLMTALRPTQLLISMLHSVRYSREVLGSVDGVFSCTSVMGLTHGDIGSATDL